MGHDVSFLVNSDHVNIFIIAKLFKVISSVCAFQLHVEYLFLGTRRDIESLELVYSTHFYAT